MNMLQRCNKRLSVKNPGGLLGSDPELVLHGGGNTSVKSMTKDIIGNDIEVLHVKGSGWDLATIEPRDILLLN